MTLMTWVDWVGLGFPWGASVAVTAFALPLRWGTWPCIAFMSLGWLVFWVLFVLAIRGWSL